MISFPKHIMFEFTTYRVTTCASHHKSMIGNPDIHKHVCMRLMYATDKRKKYCFGLEIIILQKKKTNVDFFFHTPNLNRLSFKENKTLVSYWFPHDHELANIN